MRRSLFFYTIKKLNHYSFDIHSIPKAIRVENLSLILGYNMETHPPKDTTDLGKTLDYYNKVVEKTQEIRALRNRSENTSIISSGGGGVVAKEPAKRKRVVSKTPKLTITDKTCPPPPLIDVIGTTNMDDGKKGSGCVDGVVADADDFKSHLPYKKAKKGTSSPQESAEMATHAPMMLIASVEKKGNDDDIDFGSEKKSQYIKRLVTVAPAAVATDSTVWSDIQTHSSNNSTGDRGVIDNGVCPGKKMDSDTTSSLLLPPPHHQKDFRSSNQTKNPEPEKIVFIINQPKNRPFVIIANSLLFDKKTIDYLDEFSHAQNITTTHIKEFAGNRTFSYELRKDTWSYLQSALNYDKLELYNYVFWLFSYFFDGSHYDSEQLNAFAAKYQKKHNLRAMAPLPFFYDLSYRGLLDGGNILKIYNWGELQFDTKFANQKYINIHY
jgi:hypothetical protein